MTIASSGAPLGWRLAAAAAIVFATIAVAAITVRARSSEVDTQALESAEAAYAEGLALSRQDPSSARARFLESAALLEGAARSAPTAAIHFNRANALARAGEVGHAIAAYRAAAALAPADARIAMNLAQTRSSIARRLDPPPPTALDRAGSVWGVAEESSRWLAALLLFAAGASLLIATNRPRHALALSAALALIGLAMLSASTVLLDQWRRAAVTRVAVLTEPAVLRKGNGEGFEPVLAEPLPAGTEAIRTEERPGWLSIALGDGTTGWVPASATTRP